MTTTVYRLNDDIPWMSGTGTYWREKKETEWFLSACCGLYYNDQQKVADTCYGLTLVFDDIETRKPAYVTEEIVKTRLGDIKVWYCHQGHF